MSRIVFEPAYPSHEDVLDILDSVIKSFHARLISAKVKVGMILRTKFTDDDEEVPSLKHHGAMAYATIKIVSRKARTHVDHDVEIEVDLPVWKTLSRESKVALLDHELTHVIVKDDPKTGEPKRDDLDRTCVRLRPDDYAITGFVEVVERHGLAALEYQNINRIHFAQQEALKRHKTEVA